MSLEQKHYRTGSFMEEELIKNKSERLGGKGLTEQHRRYESK